MVETLDLYSIRVATQICFSHFMKKRRFTDIFSGIKLLPKFYDNYQIDWNLMRIGFK